MIEGLHTNTLCLPKRLSDKDWQTCTRLWLSAAFLDLQSARVRAHVLLDASDALAGQDHCVSADMVSNLRLVDPSTATNPQFPEGLEMLAFSAQQHHLPTLMRSGDIIRLHRVTVSQICAS